MNSKSRNYHTFGVFLSRRKLTKSHRICELLVHKFVRDSNVSDFKKITAEDLKKYKIIPSKQYPTYKSWRDGMLKEGLLTCQANLWELEKSGMPNYKACFFKAGRIIEKYLEKAKLEHLQLGLDKVQKTLEIKADTAWVEKKLEEKADLSQLKDLENRLDSIVGILLKALPPDSEERRQIVRENFAESDKCLALLEEESKKEKNKIPPTLILKRGNAEVH